MKKHFLPARAVAPGRMILWIAICLLIFGCAGRNRPDEAGYRSLTEQVIWFYQGPLDHLTAVRYGGCPMHPGCSAYGLSAVKTHGALMGWIMTCDRLIRCGGDETRLSPEVLVSCQWKYVDTLSQNNFWWFLPDPEMEHFHSVKEHK